MAGAPPEPITGQGVLSSGGAGPLTRESPEPILEHPGARQMTRAFHVLVALLVAVPLGAGGLCCCVLGAPHDAPERVAAEPAHACCPPETPAADSDEGDTEDPHRCDCPVRETGLLASGTPEPPAPLPAPAGALTVPALDIPLGPAPEPSRVVGRAPPDRRKPLYRTLSVLLC
jgi:hypothetical protein